MPVDSKLSQRVPTNLFAKNKEVNAENPSVRKLPGSKQVTGWIEQAEMLPKIVTH